MKMAWEGWMGVVRRLDGQAWKKVAAGRWVLVGPLLLAVDAEALAVERGPGTITFVDGVQTEAEILFEHPNAPRLVVRSLSGAIAQSLPLEEIQQVTVGGETTTYNVSRELTAAEQTRRERDGIWGDAASEKRIGRYAEQTWEDRPLIVWREPGVSGDLMLPENWLDETGEPLSEPPFPALPEAEQTHGDRGVEGIFDGDILLPGAEETYEVIQPGVHDPPEIGTYQLRHLTIESNGVLIFRMKIVGNLWMKDGAKQAREVTMVLGSGDANRHTFARFCDFYDQPEPRWPKTRTLTHLLFIDPGPSGSLELIGYTRGAADRLTHMRGTLIVSEDSFLGNGPRATFYAQQDTTTILLDGARIGYPQPLKGGTATCAIAGTLMFGTPDHPLTRDLPFGGALYPQENISPEGQPSPRARGASFILGETGEMIVHSADPETARVRFQARSRSLPVAQRRFPETYWSDIERIGTIDEVDDPDEHLYRAPASVWEAADVLDGVAAVFRGRTDFNGVVFDEFYEGGIVVSPAARQQWRNVSFGENNHAEPEQLFRDID